MIRNVILDWSGTLADDLPAVWEAGNHVMRRAGKPERSLEEFRCEFRLPVAEYYAEVLPGISPRQIEQWFLERYAEVQDRVREMVRARRFLEFCRAKGTCLFLLTTVPEAPLMAQAQAMGFLEFFQGIEAGVGDKRRRIGAVLERHRMLREETVLVGDMRHDIEAARAGGVFSCAVLTGYSHLEQLRLGGPDLIVEHLGELAGLLERNGMELRPAKTGERRPVATVGGLIRDEGGRVLMIRTRKWSNQWGIPGGKIEYGEASEAALRREIREETGLEVEEIRFVMVQDCIESREFYRPDHFLLLNYVCRSSGNGAVRLNDEAQEFCWVTPDEARQLPLNRPTRVLLDAVESGAVGHP